MNSMTKLGSVVVVDVCLLACGSSGGGPTGGGGPAEIPEGGLPIAVCDPAAGPFSTTIDNPFFLPLPVGEAAILEGTEDGAPIQLQVTLLDETEVVAGVTTRVMEERESEDGELVEVSRNFVAQAADGTVCYFGEDVDDYSDGEIVGHSGAWRAGGANQPGILMPPSSALTVGTYYSEEVAPDVALDRAEIVAVGETVTVPAGSFTDTVRVREWSPLEPDVEEFKVYARGVGILMDAALQRQP